MRTTARAYSQDLSDRVLAAARANTHSHSAMAARFGVGESTVRGWLRRARTTGRTTAWPHAGGRRPTVGGDALRALAEARNHRTLAELAGALGARTGRAVGVMSVWRACRRLDLRRNEKEHGARRAKPA